MLVDFSFHYFRFLLEPKAPLQMPAYNEDNVIRGGFGRTFRRIMCHATTGIRRHANSETCVRTRRCFSRLFRRVRRNQQEPGLLG
jgi:hypothetical protein